MLIMDDLVKLQNHLDVILEKMAELKTDITEVSNCVLEQKFIPENVSTVVIRRLQEIQSLNETCQELYSKVEVESKVADSVINLRNYVVDQVTKIRNNEKLSKYKRFLLVNAVDVELQEDLEKKKVELLSLIKDFSEEKENLLVPFARFVEALAKTDTVEIAPYVAELLPLFGDKLVVNGLLAKHAYIEETSVSEETIEVDITSEDLIEEVTEAIEESVEEVVESEEMGESVLEDETAELNFEKYLKKGTYINADTFSKPLVADIKLSAENKKFSSKAFVNEFRARKNTADLVCSFVAAYEYNSVIPESVEILAEIERNKVVDALEYLLAKGYLRKYGVEEVGEFYCVSPKGTKAVQTKASREFLKLKNTKVADNTSEVIEDTVNAALTRIAYARLYYKYLEKLKKENGYTMNSADMISDEFYVLRISMEDRNEKFMCAGAFWSSSEQCAEFLETAKSVEGYESYVFVGLNEELAKINAELAVKIGGLKAKKIYYYSLLDDSFKYYETDEECDFENIIALSELYETFEVESEKIELEVEEETEEMFSAKEQKVVGTEEVVEESVAEEFEDILDSVDLENEEEDDKLQNEVEKESEKVEKDLSDEAKEKAEVDSVIETEKVCDEVKQEDFASKKFMESKGSIDKTSCDFYAETHNAAISQMVLSNDSFVYDKIGETVAIDKEEVKTNVYKIIVSDKTYCAAAYLSSLADQDMEIKELYEKFAYATDEPSMRCSYNSRTIFDTYANVSDVFSKYLMVSATLRNFFMNHVSYDYDMKSLYASVKEQDLVKNSSTLTKVIYEILTFKELVHKGINFYADYKVKDQVAVESRMKKLALEAQTQYEEFVLGKRKEKTSHARFLATKRLIFAQSDDMASYLKIVAEKEYSMVELVDEFLNSNFIKSGATIEFSNIDNQKLNDYIDSYWEKAGEEMIVSRKTSTLVSSLRNNLLNMVEKVVAVLCEWTALVEETGDLQADKGRKRYKEVRSSMISRMEASKKELMQNCEGASLEESAGKAILISTLNELISRIDGTYDERLQKYYYIDFLKGNNVLLDELFLPERRGKFDDFKELTLTNRILEHAWEDTTISFEEKLDYIFNEYGDDYGSAELILQYMEDMAIEIDADKYDLKGSMEQAEKDADHKFKDFIESLELAQSYGQIEERKENKKEKIQKIVSEWLEYAKESNNYGFFMQVMEKYKVKIQEDAKIRGDALAKELKLIKERSKIDEKMKSKIDKIEEMIEFQNYTVAEDLLSRIDNVEPEESDELWKIDYLQKFLKDHEMLRNVVADSSKTLSTVVSNRNRNKDDKGAKKLLDNWMNNGSALGETKLCILLEALGFAGAKVKAMKKIGKIDNYWITFDNDMNGRQVNYKHPISAFGSKARDDGFRVVCLFGKYDADGLIEEFKNISGKNTLVLLDYALPLEQRRRLARKIKECCDDKVYAVLDRVLLLFLVNNYNVQFINQILMSVIMPFAYNQPYVWNSSQIMPPEVFMGRKEELEKIQSPSGVNIVYGGRQLGKSALLKMAKMNIDNDENGNRALFVEIKNSDYKKAARKISEELYLSGITDEAKITEEWDELAFIIKSRLMAKDKKRIPYFLLLLDEADMFIESCEEINFAPFDALKDIQSIGMDRFKFVVAGLHNIMRFKRDAAISENSVLTHLTAITVKPFNVIEARRLLVDPLSYLGFRFPKEKEALVSLILASTNYFPGLIQLYCANLIESLRKGDYAGYSQNNTPTYEISETNIKKVLADKDFTNQIREKFEITLKLDEDNLYYIIALLLAFLYHQNSNSASEINGYSAKDIIHAGNEFSVKKIVALSEEAVGGLLQELLELNILRQTDKESYLFSRYSFFQMMGTQDDVEGKLLEYMED